MVGRDKSERHVGGLSTLERMADDDDLDVLRAAALLDLDGHDRWHVIGEFHLRTDRSAFEAARELARAGDVRERVIALDVLGRLGSDAGRPFSEEILPVVMEACADGRSRVVASAVAALSHLADPRSLPAVLAQAGHHDEDVRQAVAFTLPSVAGEPACPEAVAALVRLSRDRSDFVRDWATFGLGLESTGDCEQIRGALLERVGDAHADTAGEAFLGLARRGDRRMLAALGAALEARDPADILIEAAFESAAPELLPALRRLKQRETPGDDARTWTLDEAITACSTPAPRSADPDPEPR
ncbi:HEAT repeat domain-containing protein [Streptomyces sp. NRRL S-350]|uniref:HEAT repeat domain-containing protein n=1 Tax=Streptomyces sp. NRRL S-350 TaxID=1463902 RepID=UPI00068E4F44|nr:HEAT repeat domain-containing protein [Streptomyces sp. NRRL S-350]